MMKYISDSLTPSLFLLLEWFTSAFTKVQTILTVTFIPVDLCCIYLRSGFKEYINITTVMEKPRDYKNTYQTPSGTKKGMRDAEVCTEDIIPSVQTEDPFEAFSVQTAPTWGSLKILSMPLRVSSVRNISPLKISYIVNELLSNNIIIKKANQKKNGWNPKSYQSDKKNCSMKTCTTIWQQSFEKYQKFITLKWNNCNVICAKNYIHENGMFLLQFHCAKRYFKQQFQSGVVSWNIHNSQNHQIKQRKCVIHVILPMFTII